MSHGDAQRRRLPESSRELVERIERHELAERAKRIAAHPSPAVALILASVADAADDLAFHELLYGAGTSTPEQMEAAVRKAYDRNLLDLKHAQGADT
jgi:hypothetical protein